MSQTKIKVDVVVIGSGPGGYAAAFRAADLGLNVALIGQEANPGGVCLYKGCIPSKALLHAARVIGEAREASHFGVTFGEPKIDIDQVRAWKDGIVEKLTSGLGQLVGQRKLQFLSGVASFAQEGAVRVISKEGLETFVEYGHAIIATGSVPITRPQWPHGSKRVLNSTKALNLKEIPKKLLVIGGGYIGLELGSVYAALGSLVTVVEMAPQLIPGVDSDLVTPLRKRLETIFEAIHVSTKVLRVEEKGDGVEVETETDGKTTVHQVDQVLVSIGRKPNSKGLALKEMNVTVNERGFIEVDASRRTSNPKIFAIGDVAGDPMLAHKASHEGIVAAEVIAGHDVVFEPRAIPAVVFTDPEIAYCGLTETQAKKDGINVTVSRFPWAASGRSLSLGRSEGFTKMLVDPETERILGVGIVGPGAGELIAEGVLAIEMGATAKDMALTIHAHPTLSETMMEAAESFYGLSTHIYKPKRK